MPALARVEVSQARLEVVLAGPGGLVTGYVIRQLRAIRNLAALRCPVDTGNLRASIVTGVVRGDRLSSGSPRVEGLRVTGAVGTPVEYAAAVHEGVKAQTVVVAQHTVKAHTIKAHTVAARTQLGFTVPAKGNRAAYTVSPHTIRKHRVAARTQLGHTVPAHTRAVPAREGRPFLRKAMEQVLDHPV